jgi:hypothetical protein
LGNVLHRNNKKYLFDFNSFICYLISVTFLCSDELENSKTNQLLKAGQAVRLKIIFPEFKMYPTYLFLRQALSVILPVISIIFFGCSDNNPSEPAEIKITYSDLLEKIIKPQEEYSEKYSYLLTVMDTSEAVDSIMTIFNQNPDVLWAAECDEGINVQYKSGIRGGIVTRNRASNKPMSNDAGNYKPDRLLLKNYVNVNPLSKRTAVISILRTKLDSISESFYQWLPQIGMSLPEILIDDVAVSLNCIENFRNLEDYGVIYLSGFGRKWPADNNIEDIYLYTNIRVSEDVLLIYASDLIIGNIALISDPETKVYMGTSFISTYNNFDISRPLVIGAFNNSLHSDIAGKIGSGNGAAFVGFDGYFFNNYHFINQLLYDLTQEPITLEQWMDGPYPKSESNQGKITSINFKGPGNFSLFNGPDWPWRYVNINIYDFDAVCEISSGGSYNWNDLGFGHPYQYISISADGKTFTAEWDSLYESGSTNRGELSITVDTLTNMVVEFSFSYYAANKTNEEQGFEVQGRNIPMVYKDDKNLVNEITGTAACDAINYLTFYYTQDPGSQNERKLTLSSYSCESNSSVSLRWYREIL